MSDIIPQIQRGDQMVKFEYLDLEIPKVRQSEFKIGSHDYYTGCLFHKPSGLYYKHRFHSESDPVGNTIVDCVFKLSEGLMQDRKKNLKSFKTVDADLKKLNENLFEILDKIPSEDQIQKDLNIIKRNLDYIKNLQDEGNAKKLAGKFSTLENKIENLFSKVEKFPSRRQIADLLNLPDSLINRVQEILDKNYRETKSVSNQVREIKLELEKDILDGVKSTLQEIRLDTEISNETIKGLQQQLADEIQTVVKAEIESSHSLQSKAAEQFSKIYQAVDKMYFAYTGESLDD